MKHYHKKLTVILATLFAAVCLCVLLSACGKSSENAQPHKVTEALDKAVSNAIIDESKGRVYPDECPAEGHIILGTDEKDKDVTVYLLFDFSYFGFENENFVAVSGERSAAVMTFKHDAGKDEYTFVKAEYPSDGTEYAPSIKRLFPKKYQNRVLNRSDKDSETLSSQSRTYAKAYLEKIGRKAEIGEYGDFKYTLISSMGVSTGVENKLLEVYAKSGITFPSYIGTFEKLENSVRYVYKTSYLESTGNILYTKEEYGENKIVESYLIDGKTGDIIDKYAGKETRTFFDAKILKVNTNTLLVSPLSESDESRTADKIEISVPDSVNISAKNFSKGQDIRIVYDGQIEETYPAKIENVYDIYFYSEISYYGGDSPYGETEFTTVALTESTTSKK